MKEVIITGKTLAIDELVAVARSKAKVILSDQAKTAIKKSRKIVDDLVEFGWIAIINYRLFR